MLALLRQILFRVGHDPISVRYGPERRAAHTGLPERAKELNAVRAKGGPYKRRNRSSETVQDAADDRSRFEGIAESPP